MSSHLVSLLVCFVGDQVYTKMPTQLSTAVSDGVIVVVTLQVAAGLLSQCPLAAMAFLLMSTAASLGVVRYAQNHPSKTLVGYHQYMSWLGGVVSTNILAAAFYRQEGVSWAGNLHLICGLCVPLIDTRLPESVRDILTTIASGLPIVSILFLCMWEFNPYGIIGAVLYAGSSWIYLDKNKPYIWKMKRIDIFHYGVVLGNVAFMKGLSKTEMPIYYKRN